MPKIFDGTATRTPQDHSKSNYVGMIGKELGELDFSKSAKELERYVRGLSPWPGTFTYTDGKLLKIRKAYVINEQPDAGIKPGTIIDTSSKELWFATGDGILAVTEVQPEGKKPMAARDYINGLKGKKE